MRARSTFRIAITWSRWVTRCSRRRRLNFCGAVHEVFVVVRHLQPATAIFKGATGNRLVADVYGDGGQPVLLLHGGGQTRHAWRRTAEHLGQARATAYALDLRGHGDSEWVEGGHYAFTDFAADAAAVAATLTERSGRQPIAIGASLGGMASLLAEGEAEKAGRGPVFAAIVLVDITPRVNREGVE